MGPVAHSRTKRLPLGRPESATEPSARRARRKLRIYSQSDGSACVFLGAARRKSGTLMTIPAEAPDQTAAGEGTAPIRRARKSASLAERLYDLGPRVASALILTAVAVVTWLTGGVPFLIAWLAGSLIVHLEWQRLLSDVRLALRLAVGGLAILATAFLANGSSL